MTFIFLFLFAYMIVQAGSNKATATVGKYAKAAPTPVPAKQPAKPAAPRLGAKRRISTALYGDKALMVELCVCEGDIIRQRTYVRVQWANSTTCHAEDGPEHHQFVMVLEDGKRVNLPITVKDDGKWVTYQGQRYNRWDSMVHSRVGLLDVLRGGREASFA
jgi:hypothetical protein